MKKIISLILCTVMALSLFACSTDTQEEPVEKASLSLGFGRVCITPEMSVPLNGYGSSSNRLSTEVLDDLYITCLAMSDGEKTVLLFSQDLNSTTATLLGTMRTELYSAVDVPESNIFIAATGNCSGPDLKSEHESMETYIPFYKSAVIQAAQDAIADLAPATLYCATTEAEGMNFVHHYTMADGTVEDGYYGFFDREITGHAAEAVDTMRLVKAERKGKEPIVLINWQCCPILAAYKDLNIISADYIGYMRNKLEADIGAKTVYFTGAYGDLSPFSLIESENITTDVQEYGEKLADIAAAALEDMTLLEGSTTLATDSRKYTCPVNDLDVDKVDAARKVIAERKKNGDKAADKLAKKLGFRSVYQAANIPGRVGRDAKYALEFSVVRLGELAFLMSPSPLFGATGEEIQSNAYTDFTFVVCQANGAWNTMPSEEAFTYGGYEADVSYFAKGSGEKVGWLLSEMVLMTTD